MALFTGTAAGLAALLNKLLTAGFGATLLNDFAGGRFGNLFSGRGFRTDFDIQMDMANRQGGITSSNIGLNLRLLEAMRRRSRTTAEKKQQSALTFLGDRSRKLDDATDIDMDNDQVLQGIPNFQGLITPSTVVPAIENPRILNPGFEGVRLEIEKINRNIDALKQAMIVSAALEAKYRKSLIEDMEEALAKKGKDRSETRSERSIFNLITRPKEEVVKQVGSLANNLTNALMLSLGLEVGGALADAFGGPTEGGQGGGEGGQGGGQGGGEGGGENTPPPPASSSGKNTPQVGDYIKVQTSRGARYKVWDGEKYSGNSNVKPQGGRDLTNSIESGSGDSVDLSMGNINNQFGEGSNIAMNTSLGEGSNIAMNTSLGGDNFSINPNFDTIRKPVDAGNGQTQIIDLRTAQNLAGGEQPSSASTALDNAIAELDPERRFSPYESYVRSV